jgi:hypothetical protein
MMKGLVIFIAFVLDWASALSSTELRRLDTIGIVKDSCSSGDGLIVLTESNVLALLSPNGAHLWRSNLPPTEQVYSIACSKAESFVLSTIQTPHRAALGMLRAYSPSSGALLWELSLPPVQTNFNSTNSELLYDETRNALLVLNQGEVSIVESSQLWSPAPDHSKEKIPFTKLIAASSSNINDFQLVAVGCVLKNSACAESVTLSAQVSTRTYRLDRHGNLAEITLSDSLQAFTSISRDANPCVSVSAWSAARAGEELTVSWQQRSRCGSNAQASLAIKLGSQDSFSFQGIAAQTAGPALLLCAGRRCGVLVPQTQNHTWVLQADDDWLGEDSIQGSSRHAVVSKDKAACFLRITSIDTAPPSRFRDMLLTVPAIMLPTLASCRYVTSFGESRLLVVDSAGLGLLLAATPQGGYSLLPPAAGVRWASNEGLAQLRHGFVLNPSPSLHHSHARAVLASHASLPCPCAQLGLRIHGLALAGEEEEGQEEDWLVAPQLPAEATVRRVSALALRWPPGRGPAQAEEDLHSNALLLAVDTLLHGCFVFLLDALHGEAFLSLSAAHPDAAAAADVVPLPGLRYRLASPAAHLPSLGQQAALLYVSSCAATGFALVYSTGSNQLLELRPVAVAVAVAAEVFPAASASASFLHSLSPSGELQVFRTAAAAQCSPEQQPAGFACRAALPVAQALLGSSVLSVAYADPLDALRSPAVTLLSDDNLLRKHHNPNLLVAVCAEQAQGLGQGQGLAVSVLDAASGRLVKRLALEHAAATAPVQSLLVDNLVLVSYWNAQAKRNELLASALYEGFIGKHELTPGWRWLPRWLGAQGQAVDARSAFAHTQLLSVEKTFALPRALSSLQRTVSAKGMTNRNLLLCLDSGEVFSLDLRWLHPRRPATEPTPAEKEEGLQRYLPMVALQPTQSLTGAKALEGSGVLRAVAAPSNLESTCTVLLFAQAGSRGVAVLTHMPAQGFDTLAPDFNRPLLLLLLSALAVCVLALRYLHAQNTLRTLWL